MVEQRTENPCVSGSSPLLGNLMEKKQKLLNKKIEKKNKKIEKKIKKMKRVKSLSKALAISFIAFRLYSGSAIDHLIVLARFPQLKESTVKTWIRQTKIFFDTPLKHDRESTILAIRCFLVENRHVSYQFFYAKYPTVNKSTLSR